MHLRFELSAWRPNLPPLRPCGNPDCLQHRPLPRALACQWDGRRLCSPECYAAAAEADFARLLPALAPAPAPRHRMPLGLLMVEQGFLAAEDLRRALAAQQQAGAGRIGYWLMRLGFASESHITAALARQWGCSVFPLAETACEPAVSRLLPRALLLGFGLVPAHFAAARRTLFVACRDGIVRSALYAMERMLGLTLEPCFADASAVDARLAALSRVRGAAAGQAGEALPNEASFDSPFSAAELAACARGYAVKLRLRSARAVTCSEYLWVRCAGAETHFDLVFHRPHRRMATFGPGLP